MSESNVSNDTAIKYHLVYFTNCSIARVPTLRTIADQYHHLEVHAIFDIEDAKDSVKNYCPNCCYEAEKIGEVYVCGDCDYTSDEVDFLSEVEAKAADCRRN